MKKLVLPAICLFAALAWGCGTGHGHSHDGDGHDHDHGAADHAHAEGDGHDHDGADGDHGHDHADGDGHDHADGDHDHAAEAPILERPFTAEQIRDEMTEGLVIDIHRVTADLDVRERWTVVKADQEGVDIEYVTLGADDQPVGEIKLQRSPWTELRDHASFARAISTRATTTRETELGTFDGWLYTVNDEAAGTVTEFFFAKKFPGAPLHVKMTRGDELVMEMSQLRRDRP